MSSSKGKEVVESPPPKTITLRCTDGEEFVLEESGAGKGSQTISNLIEDLSCYHEIIPLPNVTGPTMTKIIAYWEKHQEHGEDAGEMKRWDSEFVAGMDRDDLFDHLLSAHYLACQPLMDLLSQAVADKIKDMKVEDVREYFTLENDWSEEEEKKLREQNAWAFD